MDLSTTEWHGFTPTKSEFRDAVHIRYDCLPTKLPSASKLCAMYFHVLGHGETHHSSIPADRTHLCREDGREVRLSDGLDLLLY